MKVSLADEPPWGVALALAPRATIAGADSTFARMHGYDVEELAGRALIDLAAVGAREVWHRELGLLAPSGRRTFECEHLRKDGTSFLAKIELAQLCVSHEARTLDVVQVSDLSAVSARAEAHRLAMISLARTREALEVAHQEIEAFSHSVAHDLRAPLRAIDGFSHALIEEYGDKLDDTGREYLGYVRDSADRMSQLIDDVLSLSRVSRASVRIEDVDLSALASILLVRLAKVDAERVVRTRVAPGIVARADARLLEVLLASLLDNAWKFTRRRAEAHIEVGMHEEAGIRTYFVRDDGVGFDMAHAQRLFGLFRRLHGVREFEGTGVGLASVQRIVQRHGGRVWARAVVDGGATFHFTLGDGDRR